MKEEARKDDFKKPVEQYFKLIRDLRSGDEASVPKLMEMWDQDGVFEFVGAPPLVATYKGAVAIQTLYKNRLQSSKMPIRLEGKAGTKATREATLGIVDTEVTHLRTNGNRAVAGWRTTIGTAEGAGFDVAGSHQFTFENGRIKNLRVSISPKADDSRTANLTASELTVTDVGRLSLAAWPVV